MPRKGKGASERPEWYMVISLVVTLGLAAYYTVQEIRYKLACRRHGKHGFDVVLAAIAARV
jgi:hypothetical protein